MSAYRDFGYMIVVALLVAIWVLLAIYSYVANKFKLIKVFPDPAVLQWTILEQETDSGVKLKLKSRRRSRIVRIQMPKDPEEAEKTPLTASDGFVGETINLNVERMTMKDADETKTWYRATITGKDELRKLDKIIESNRKHQHSIRITTFYRSRHTKKETIGNQQLVEQYQQVVQQALITRGLEDEASIVSTMEEDANALMTGIVKVKLEAISSSC
eukprot:TRINITY_DN3124_c0_g1_i2.p1 TRINITY_DN3124_c0_g1~~TRINITY_DN3124_c0_g1_i2.p1  ORF type:complete len:216 (+),score=37.52 TRINITY_DN3124_c0_g1_i2:55-702(+)